MDHLYQTFASSLRAARQARGWSQAELAERVQIGRGTIASIEASRQAVLLHQAVALAKELNVPLADLVDGPRSDLEHLRGVIADDDLRKIVDLTRGLR